MTTVGILGGTFDPIHNGHLHLALQAAQTFDLQKVFLIPAGQPPHKDRTDIIDPKHRLKMVSLVSAMHTCLDHSDMELYRSGKSYTADTLREFHQRSPAHKYRLIIGADMLPDLHLWRDIHEVIRLAPPIISTRPGNRLSKEEMSTILNPSLHPLIPELLPGLLMMDALAISSSEIRERLQKNLSVEKWVPAEVANYIAEHQLYRAHP